MSALLTQQVRIILDVEVTVEGIASDADPEGEADVAERDLGAQRRLLQLVLADPDMASFFVRHAAAVPLTDWLQDEPVGLEWLREEPELMARAIRHLPAADQVALRTVLEQQLDGELDRFYAAFRTRYVRVEMAQLA